MIGTRLEASSRAAMARQLAARGRVKKIAKLPWGEDQGLAHGHLHHRAQEEGQHQRRRVELELPHQVAQDAEAEHQLEVQGGEADGVGADDAEEQDHGEDDAVGQLQHLHP